MAKRKKAEYVIEKKLDTGGWERLAIQEGAEIHSVQDAEKYCRDNKIAGDFRVVAIKDEFSFEAETKMKLTRKK